jgi:hypothetical protein
MRQIYLLASDADEPAAAEVEALLQQRGYVVRRAEEKFGFPPARWNEITLALWSRAVAVSLKQVFFTNRAIDAWLGERLILARLDHTLQPRGLGDVEAIDLSFEPARVAAVWKIVEAAEQIDRLMERARPEPEDEGRGEEDFRGPYLELDAEETAGSAAFSSSHAWIVGLVAASAFLSAGYISLPEAPPLLVGLGAVLWGTLIGIAVGLHIARRDGDGVEVSSAQNPAAPMREDAPTAPAADAMAQEPTAEGPSGVFVSYARRDSDVVYPMVAEIEAAGQAVWIDKDGLEAGEHWAGMIVRAIRESETFCLMCSAESFQSDNVRREIYIANKYRRKMLPVRLDFAEMPDDFEYFLIDRQWLDLTTVDAAERAARLTAALAR